MATLETETQAQTRTLVNYRVGRRRRGDRAGRSPGEHVHPRDDAAARRGDPQGSLRRRRPRPPPPRGGGEVLLGRREHLHAQQRHAGVQVLLLSPRQRDPAPAGAHAEARDRGAERPHGGRGPRDRDGRRHPDRPQGRRQDRPPRGHPGRSPRHGRHHPPGPARLQVGGDRADGPRQHLLLRGGRALPGHRQPCLGSLTRGVLAADPRLRPAIRPAEQGFQGGGPDQALRTDGLRDPPRRRPGAGARAPAAALPERGCQGRHQGVRGQKRVPKFSGR